MEVTCTGCNAKLNIPDEKIPRDQIIKISCPKCKNKITLDTRTPPREESPRPEAESKPAAVEEEKGYNYDDYSGDQALGFFEEGGKLALVMAGNAVHIEKIRGAVEGLGYRFIASPNARDAFGKLRFQHFDLVILSEGFDGQQLDKSSILNHLNHVSMSVRRRIFLALLSDQFKTMDNMMAFAKSANLVINMEDMDRLSGILKKAIADNEMFYRIFQETLVEVGKA